MSHDIDTSTGTPAMAYVGSAPWHDLGQKLPEGRPIEDWIVAAGLNWQIRSLPLRYEFEGTLRHMTERVVLVRNDNGAALSVVSTDYRVVQPKEVLEFYRDLVCEKHYKLETAGALDEGRKVWALARTGLVADVANNAADKLGAYVLLATSCDKSLATTVTFTSVRVVCQNTLAFAFTDAKQHMRRSFKVNHAKKFDPDEAKRSLGLIDAAWKRFVEQLTPMANRKLDEGAARSYFNSLFVSDKDLAAGKEPSPAKQNEVAALLSQFLSPAGPRLPTTEATLWGALNAVTYYVDHLRGKGAGGRLDSAWFGQGAELKDKAWHRALEVAGGPPS